jgi:hypothetical protein
VTDICYPSYYLLLRPAADNNSTPATRLFTKPHIIDNFQIIATPFSAQKRTFQ